MTEHTDEQDPFSQENIGVVNFIVMSRIYDVLMTLLQDKNPPVAEKLLNLHQQGHILMPTPNMSGMFLSDDEDEE